MTLLLATVVFLLSCKGAVSRSPANYPRPEDEPIRVGGIYNVTGKFSPFGALADDVYFSTHVSLDNPSPWMQNFIIIYAILKNQKKDREKGWSYLKTPLEF
jgi:hypothetical protein